MLHTPPVSESVAVAGAPEAGAEEDELAKPEAGWGLDATGGDDGARGDDDGIELIENPAASTETKHKAVIGSKGASARSLQPSKSARSTRSTRSATHVRFRDSVLAREGLRVKKCDPCGCLCQGTNCCGLQLPRDPRLLCRVQAACICCIGLLVAAVVVAIVLVAHRAAFLWKHSGEGAYFSLADGDASLQFIVLGDWGLDGGDYQYDVATEMGMAARRNNVSFVITAGDNFYYEGLKTPAAGQSWGDTQLRTSWLDIYIPEEDGGGDLGNGVVRMPPRTPWYAVAGNHDYKGEGPDTQVALSRSGQYPLWRFPARHYAFEVPIPAAAGGGCVYFVQLDTIPFISAYRHDEPAIAKNLEGVSAAAERLWAEAQIKNGTSRCGARHTFVSGHHPLYSGGKFGTSQEMIDEFGDMFELQQAGSPAISAYFAGHDHNLQHLRHAGGSKSVKAARSVDYFISGGGAMRDDRLKAVPQTHYESVSAGFLGVSVTNDVARFTFVSDHGEVLYTYTKRSVLG